MCCEGREGCGQDQAPAGLQQPQRIHRAPASDPGTCSSTPRCTAPRRRGIGLRDRGDVAHQIDAATVSPASVVQAWPSPGPSYWQKSWETWSGARTAAGLASSAGAPRRTGARCGTAASACTSQNASVRCGRRPARAVQQLLHRVSAFQRQRPSPLRRGGNRRQCVRVGLDAVQMALPRDAGASRALQPEGWHSRSRSEVERTPGWRELDPRA